MNKKKKRRIVSIVVLVVMLLSALLPTLAVFAEQPEPGSTNSKTTNMLSLFRKMATEIDAGKVPVEEYRVYGVFISNYFMPGKTTVKDIKSDAIVNKVSTSFFGNSDNANAIKELNNKLYEGITHTSDGLGSADAYVLTSKDGSPMSGARFLSEIGVGGKVFLKGKEVIDFKKDKAMRGALQILMGVSPDLFIGAKKGDGIFASKKSVGIGVMDMLYMDGVGNIWGSYKPEGGGSLSVDDYVLIMPGSLNPLTFNRGKLPLTNAFAMGAMIDVKEAGLVKDEENVRPYYNVKSQLGSGEDFKNMMSIYGVHSPTKYVGNTDSIIKSGNKLKGGELKSAISKFTSNTGGSKYSQDELKIILSLDMSKYKDFTKNLGVLFDNDEQKRGFAKYFATNMVFGMGEISDDMYFFNSSGGGTGIDSVGNFEDDEALMKMHRMFAEDKGGSFSFYANGLTASKFSLFLTSYVDASGADAKKKVIFDKLISPKLGGKQSDYKDKINSIYSFLENGTFGSEGSIKSKEILETLYIMYGQKRGSYSGVLYNTVLKPKTTIKYDANWFVDDYGVAVGMGHLDTALTNASIPGTSLVKGKEPFLDSASSGRVKDKLSKAEQEYIATLFHTVNSYNLFSIDSAIKKALTGEPSNGLGGAFGSDLTTPWGKYKTYTEVSNGVNNWPGIYWGYTVGLLGTRMVDGKLVSGGWANNYLPGLTINTTGTLDYSDVLTGGVAPSDDKTIEDMQKDIIRKIYGLLSEDDNSYRASLIESTLDGFILATHRTLVGSWVGENFVVGTGKTYTSAVGYLSTPSLNDLPLTSWLLDDYAMIYMFSLLVLLMIIVVMVITNVRTVQEGFLTFIIMGIVLMIPQSLIVNVVDITNSMTDNIYSEKFNYWAISQHHELMENGLKAGGGAESDMAYTMSMNKDFSSSDARVRIKWMSPKKEDEFDKLYSSESKLDGVENNLVLSKFLMGSFLTQDEYVMNSNESYLYRPYTKIAVDAKNMHLAMSGGASDLATLKKNIQIGKGMVSNVPSYRYDGLMGNIVEGGNKDLLSKVDTYSVDSEVKTDYRYWGLGNFNITSAIFRDTYTIEDAGLTGYTSDSESDAFFLLTESPYYYFYNVFKERYGSVSGGFKNALLEKDVFKVSGTGTDADGKIRDFMDMDGLFTTIVPYLKQSNEYVNGWTRVFGQTIDTYDFEAGGAGDDYQEEYESAKRKKEALKKVWMMYSPWVDAIYESAGGKERIEGLKLLDDPLNPGAYANVSNTRRMCFSPAEMEANGYNTYTLTDAEVRIHKVLEKTYEDMMYLINYYDFNDEVLLSMAAMMATFNFNTEFSQYRLFGSSTVIYPQNFELKNFNFDAFMRLMLVNSTGEPMKGEGDLYERVLAKTSFFTGVLLLIVDILGVIVIPAIKILALLLLFLLSVVIGFSCILVPTDKIWKRVIDSLFKPMLLLMVSMVGFSFGVSLFMGEGYTSYVGSKTPTLGITDPNILMVLMALISCAYVYVLFKIVSMVWKSLKNDSVASALGMVSSLAGLVTVASTMVAKRGRDVASSGASMGVQGAKMVAKSPMSMARGAADMRHGYQDMLDAKDELQDKFRDMRNKGDFEDNPNITNNEMGRGNHSPIMDSRGSEDLSSDIDRLASKRGTHAQEFSNMSGDISEGINEKVRDSRDRTTQRRVNKNPIARGMNSISEVMDDHAYASQRASERKEKKAQKKEEQNKWRAMAHNKKGDDED